MVTTNTKTAKVIELLKNGDKTPQDFISSKEKLRSQGIDVDLIETGLKKRGMLGSSGNIAQQAMGAINEEGQIRADLLKNKGMGKSALNEIGQLGESVKGLIESNRPQNTREAIYPGMVGARIATNLIKNSPEIAKQLGISMGTSAAHPISSFGKPVEHVGNLLTMLAAAGKAGKLVKGVMPGKDVVGKSVAESTSLATGIKPELTERWISRTPQVFTKENLSKNAFANVGKQVKESVKSVGKEYSKAVNAESKALEGIQTPVKFLDDASIKKLGEITAKRMYQIDGMVQGIDPEDMALIGKFQSILTRPLSVSTGHKIKLELDELLKSSGYYNNSSKTVKPLSDVLQQSLHEMRSTINNKLGVLSTPYAEANARSAALLNATEVMKGPLNAIDPGTQLKNILSKNPEKAEALKAVSDALPDKLKFWDKIMDVEAAQESNRIFRKGGGILGSLGIAGLAGGGTYGATKNIPLSVMAMLGTSPKVTSLGLRGVAGISGGLDKAGNIPLKQLLATQLGLKGLQNQ